MVDSPKFDTFIISIFTIFSYILLSVLFVILLPIYLLLWSILIIGTLVFDKKLNFRLNFWLYVFNLEYADDGLTKSI